MKKIPTLFTRLFENGKIVGITPEITPGCEEAFRYGTATVKWDGACCAMIDGVFYKRYDAKHGKLPPDGAIPCCDPDPITGHWPHWVRVDENNPADRWFVQAARNYHYAIDNGTFEAVGPHFQGNPYGLEADTLVQHGKVVLDVPRTLPGIKRYLHENEIEGIVFWLDGEPVCKIKRSDFGFSWKENKRR